MKVYGTADAKHDTFSKSALHENQMHLHVSMSLTPEAINRSLEDSDSVWACGGNTNSCDFTMNKLYETKI
jgi:peptidase E